MKKLTVTAAERVLGIPAKDWEGACYGIACAFVKNKLADGVAVYGHWRGPVAEKSIFFNKSSLGFVQHGWVLLPDNSIIDPTRWCFEAVKPYVYKGPNDHYDEGGNAWRAQQRSRIPPDYDKTQKHFKLTTKVMPEQTWHFVEKLLMLESWEQPRGEVTFEQLLWLANTDPKELGAHAPYVYDALDKLGKHAFIPIDNYRMVQRMRGVT